MDTTRKTTTKKVKDRPMKVVGKKYPGVSELVRDTCEPEFADEFDTYQAERGLVNSLTVVRCANGVSQAELAGRMRCGQPKVSRMESSVDADLNFGDITSYAFALKQSVHITFSPARKNGVDHIRFHVECIKHELDRLVKVAGDDRRTGDGVEAFAIETLQNMVTMFEGSLDRLPHRTQQSDAAVSVEVEVEGERGQRLPLDVPKRARKPSRKIASMA